MIKYIVSEKNRFRITVLHALIGFSAFLSSLSLIFWYYFVALSSFGVASRGVSAKKIYFFVALIAYVSSFELLSRMARCSPLIPHEMGKYVMILAFIASIISRIKVSSIGIIMFLLLVPSFFIDLSGRTSFDGIIYNVFGPVALSLSIAIMNNKSVLESDINNIIKTMWLPIFSSSIFLFFKTPDLETVEFTLHAQSSTTAGHASNQVSTIIGLGFFLAAYSWINRLNFSGYRLVDGAIMLLFFFQGLISFSRGGILTGVLALFIYILLSASNREKVTASRNKKSLVGVILIAVAIVITFSIADSITGGKLTLRYEGETEGTLIGEKEKNLAHLTTGRSIIFLEDVSLWLQNPILGVGAGASMFLRSREIAPHLETSRLLAENGLPGIIFFILLIRLGFTVWRRNVHSNHRPLLIALYTIGFLTTFHAGMRTFITPLLVGISLLNIRTQNNNSL